MLGDWKSIEYKGVIVLYMLQGELYIMSGGVFDKTEKFSNDDLDDFHDFIKY